MYFDTVAEADFIAYIPATHTVSLDYIPQSESNDSVSHSLNHCTDAPSSISLSTSITFRLLICGPSIRGEGSSAGFGGGEAGADIASNFCRRAP
jgi:hypothetical protein